MKVIRTTYEEYYGVNELFNSSSFHPIVVYEIEKEDEEDIKGQIIEYLKENLDFPPNTLTIWLYDNYGEDIEIDINPYEYLTKEEMKKIIEEAENENTNK